ncbi:hypothetical protein BRAS3843_690011 [Bradyrhizobium sp. STM 3843]|nr:hypothetical protein BRAS3843_690011 [Bradyrhizobium sp. STM 3843]
MTAPPHRPSNHLLRNQSTTPPASFAMQCVPRAGPMRRRWLPPGSASARAHPLTFP